MATTRREMHSLMEDTSTRPPAMDCDVLVIGGSAGSTAATFLPRSLRNGLRRLRQARVGFSGETLQADES